MKINLVYQKKMELNKNTFNLFVFHANQIVKNAQILMNVQNVKKDSICLIKINNVILANLDV